MGLHGFASTLLVIGVCLLLVSDHSWAFKKKYFVKPKVTEYSYQCYRGCSSKTCFCVDTSVCSENRGNYIIPGIDRRPRIFVPTGNCSRNEICCPVLPEDHWETLSHKAKHSDVVFVKRCCETKENCTLEREGGDFPWMLAVYYKKPAGRTNKFLCGAVLIRKDLAMLPTKCIQQDITWGKARNVLVSLAGVKMGSENTLVEVENVSKIGDFSLLQLPKDRTKEMPVLQIATNETTVPYHAYHCCTFLEWGRSQSGLKIYNMEPTAFRSISETHPAADKHPSRQYKSFGGGPLVCIFDNTSLILLGFFGITNKDLNDRPVPFYDARAIKSDNSVNTKHPFRRRN